MSFREILNPFLRVVRWSGLHPISPNPEKIDNYRQFAITTGISLSINILGCIEDCSYFDIDPGYGSTAKLSAYVTLFMALLLRFHVITVLIEALTKRTMHSKLLTQIDETEKLFRNNLHFACEQRQLRVRLHKFLYIFLGKNIAIFLISTITVIITKQKSALYLIVSLFSFYTSALSFPQLMVYVDVIRYNIERTNKCLALMCRTTQSQIDDRVYRIEVLTVDTVDECDRIGRLRECWHGIWQTSMLINRCFQWSLFVGSGNELYLFVSNLYWILLYMKDARFDLWFDIAFSATWASIVLSNFLFLSIICDDINRKVNTYCIGYLANSFYIV